MEKKRKLVDITLEEATEVLRLGEGFYAGNNYQIRKRNDIWGEPFAQLFFDYDNQEHIAANFGDHKNAVSIFIGNTYYRTMYRIVKYLEKQGFDLESANKKD
jgi:hypothetical protein